MTIPVIVLFDGYCNLCSGLVNFIIQRDKEKKFRFASLQSEIGIEIIQNHKLSEGNNSVYLIAGEKSFEKSKAVFRIAQVLGLPWNLLGIFKILGSGINNKIYDFVARNRYRWFGKKDHCMIPTKEVLDRFLS